MYITSGGMDIADRTRNLLCYNTSDVGNWLAVRLDQGGHAIMGARVTLTAGDTTQVRRIGSGAGFSSHNSPIAHFGLGDGTSVDQVTVRWPDGHTESVLNPRINQTILMTR